MAQVFELIIKFTADQALDVTVPATLLAGADKVAESWRKARMLRELCRFSGHTADHHRRWPAPRSSRRLSRPVRTSDHSHIAQVVITRAAKRRRS